MNLDFVFTTSLECRSGNRLLRSNVELPSEFYEIYLVDPANKPQGALLLSSSLRLIET